MRFVRPQPFKVDTRAGHERPSLSATVDYLPVEYKFNEIKLPEDRMQQGCVLAKMIRNVYNGGRDSTTSSS